jgi:myosin-1
VSYEVTEFLSKNRDTLFGDLLGAVRSSKNSHVQEMFPDLNKGVKDMKRPPTIGFQFKGAVDDLIQKLNACQPHYIRCIKSNENKRGGMFDDVRVRHQVRYLNLVETVRVRRAGFCSRQPYERFLARYKVCAPKTW